MIIYKYLKLLSIISCIASNQKLL